MDYKEKSSLKTKKKGFKAALGMDKVFRLPQLCDKLRARLSACCKPASTSF